MADNENFQSPTDNLPAETEHSAVPSGEAKDAPPPERLRVHSLARVLGTTSKRIIDALVEMDGRTRSAHSTVGREEADQVREALAEPVAAEAAVPAPVADPEPEAVPEPVADVEASVPSVAEQEPESRLILETPDSDPAETADYLPLFVAPQPVRFGQDSARTDDNDDDDDDDDDDDERTTTTTADRKSVV